jgi:WD40 repeat protein
LFEEPLLELVAPTYDYVCDVKWSPVNGSLFSTITSGGVLAIWDISRSIVEPQDSMDILNESGYN